MKQPLLIIAFLSLLPFADHHLAMAQSPEGFTYQAVVRDGSGDLVTSATVGMRISILDAIGPDNAVYVETHSASTNANGLVSLTVGSGTSGDDFSAIDWGSGAHYIKTETDPAGGTSYTVSATQQLMSVPYALYAATSGTAEFLAGHLPETWCSMMVPLGWLFLWGRLDSSCSFLWQVSPHGAGAPYPHSPQPLPPPLRFPLRQRVATSPTMVVAR